MKPISSLLSIALLGALLASPAKADDVADATAASDAFYAALPVLDDGSAMTEVFAQTPYVTFVGPSARTSSSAAGPQGLLRQGQSEVQVAQVPDHQPRSAGQRQSCLGGRDRGGRERAEGRHQGACPLGGDKRPRKATRWEMADGLASRPAGQELADAARPACPERVRNPASRTVRNRPSRAVRLVAEFAGRNMPLESQRYQDIEQGDHHGRHTIQHRLQSVLHLASSDSTTPSCLGPGRRDLDGGFQYSGPMLVE